MANNQVTSGKSADNAVSSPSHVALVVDVKVAGIPIKGIYDSSGWLILSVEPGKLKDILPDEVAGFVPDCLRIKSLFAAYGMNDKAFVIGLDLGLHFRLSDLPVVGGSLPGVGLETIKFLLITGPQASATGSDTGAKPTRKTGLTVSAGVNYGIGVKNVDFSLSDAVSAVSKAASGSSSGSSSTSKTASSSASSSASSKTTPAATGTPGKSEMTSKNGVMRVWLGVNKTIGPVTLKRLGFEYNTQDPEDPSLQLLLDASFKMAGLGFAMEGLGIGSSLRRFSPKFSLDGMSVYFKAGVILISGGFKHYRDDDSYMGGIIIKISKFTISAYGGYKELEDGSKSIFIYGVVKISIGGPVFLSLEGLAVGFGYNREVLVPEAQYMREFPLVKAVVATEEVAEDIFGILDSMKKAIPVKRGSIFFAVGVQFSSFKLVKSFALLIIQVDGNDFSIDLIGVSSVSLPPESPQAMVQIELAVRVGYSSKDGALKVEAALTSASYLFTPACHLTGGFAFYVWCAGSHAGEFVITIGGFHPDYKTPSYYPNPPRLGFSWVVSSQLSIKGGAYMALTPSAIMAGARLEVTCDLGFARAWLIASADFLISWKPFYYSIKLSIEIGVAVGSLEFHISASLKIWGPEFSGIATVDITVAKFDVTFGADAKGPDPLTWSEFKTTFLPDSKNACMIHVRDGLVKETSDGVFMVNAAELVFSTESMIPAASALRKGAQTQANLDGGKSFGIGTMGLDNIVSSVQTIEITKLGEADDKSEDFSYQPLYKDMPSALWGNVASQKLNGQRMIPDLMAGYTITPGPKLEPRSLY